MSTVAVLVFLAAIVGVFRPYIDGAKRWQFGVAAFLAFAVVGITAPKTAPEPGRSTTPVNTATTKAAATTGSAATAPAGAEEVTAWVYQTKKDEMRGGEDRFAQVDALEPIKLDFPYGEQTGQILVRQSSKFGFDILVGVPSGQILCNSFQNTHVSVKFDNGPVQKFACTDANDGSNNMVFIENSKSFLSQLKKSRKTVVEAEFFQNGLQQMTFNTANLNWK
ncbi:hypothetical protein [Novosphingobium sp.]|uniref:hypothetical protein n=1 Tax=Novosphingobium sp. TaxID=1874826 RepID=UPI003BA8D380